MSRRASYKKGDRLDNTIILRRAGSAPNGNALWLCKCSCGNKFTKSTSDLQRGWIFCKSCQKPITGKKIGDANRKHVVEDIPCSKSLSHVKLKIRTIKAPSQCIYPGCTKLAEHDCMDKCRECFINDISVYQPVGVVSTLSGC